MKLTETQRRGIEARFAVLVKHTLGNLAAAHGVQWTNEERWLRLIQYDIETCRDEVITLVERLEPLLDGVE